MTAARSLRRYGARSRAAPLPPSSTITGDATKGGYRTRIEDTSSRSSKCRALPSKSPPKSSRASMSAENRSASLRFQRLRDYGRQDLMTKRRDLTFPRSSTLSSSGYSRSIAKRFRCFGAATDRPTSEGRLPAAGDPHAWARGVHCGMAERCRRAALPASRRCTRRVADRHWRLTGPRSLSTRKEPPMN